MKRILLIITIQVLGLSTFGQLNRVEGEKRDALVIEQLCLQHFNLERFKVELSNQVNPELIHEIGEDYNEFATLVHQKVRFKLINSYMKSEYDLLVFNQKLEEAKQKIYKIINERFIEADNHPHQFGVSSTIENSFVELIRDKIHGPGHQHRGPGDPCVNPDFEMCNFTNWVLRPGTVPYPSAAPFSFTPGAITTSFTTVNSYGTSSADQHYICTGGTDGIGGFPMVYPGGTCSAEIGNFGGYNNGASQISQTFLVSAGDAILVLNYAVCLEDAGHTANEQPFFRMRVYDGSGGSIACAEYEAVAGDGQPGWATSGGWQYKPWTTVFIPLAPYLGQNVTVEFTVGDCAQGGHAGYAYVDAQCDAMSFNMSASAVCAGQPITITGPPGAASYLWNTGATTQSITTSTPGAYSVTVIPVTGVACGITLDTVVLASPNPIANFNNNAPVCAGIPVNFTDISNPNGSTIGTWAWNFGDGNTSNLQNPTHTYAAPGNYNVTLTVTSTAGCTNSITIPVTINNGTPPIINPAGPFCSTAAPVILTANSGGGTWSATCGACINSVTGEFNPALATLGNNTITYTIAGACGGNDTETIVIQNLTMASINSTDASCFGGCNGQVTANAVGATQYSIDNGVTFQPGGNFTGLCAGNYTVIAQNALGCQATGNIPVNQPTALVLPINSTPEICPGSCNGTATVIPSGGVGPYTMSWSTGSGNVTTATNLCNGGPYTATVTDNNGCTLSSNVNVALTLAPPLNVVALQNASICIGSNASISANASGGDGSYTYSWNDGAGNILPGPNHTVNPSVTTTYTVTVTDNCLTPAATAQVTITVNPLPVVSFVADILQGCTPVVTNFTNTTDPALTGNCSWNFGDGNTSNNCVASHTFATPGCYNITLTVTSPAGCVGSLTQNSYICVFPYPVADFTFGPQPADIMDPEINFVNQSTGAIIYDWNFAGLGTSTQVNPTFVFPDEEPGSYTVCLEVENQHGCIDDICKVVVINDFFTIYVPNAFTPDGDGKNDVFFAFVDGIVPSSFELMIFNRWGDLIFTTNDPNGFWDGMHRGQKAQQDVYVWKIKLKDNVEGKKRSYYGHVSLLR